MARKATALVLVLGLFLLSTVPGWAYYEKDPSLEYLRVGQRLVEQIDEGHSTSRVTVFGYAGRIYGEEETQQLMDDLSLLVRSAVSYPITGVRIDGTVNQSNQIQKLSASLTMKNTDTFWQADQKAQKIARDIQQCAVSQEDMVRKVNRYIIDHVSYPAVIDRNKPELWTAYGALIQGEAVCQGYASAFSLILKHLDIPTVFVYGTAEGGDHVWNQVKVGDRWLFVDVTFNDPVITGGSSSSATREIWYQRYLLLTAEEFYAKKVHVARNAEFAELAKDVFFRNHMIPEADQLKEANLFLGDGDGYRLSDGLSRVEMAVMLTRLHGGIEEVEANKEAYAALDPFTDVPDWGKPYVGYCYAQGLVVGIGNDLYNAEALATKLDYSTVLLRFAGIENFDYRQADKRAMEAGFLTLGRAAFSDLHRGDVVFMTRAKVYAQACDL